MMLLHAVKFEVTVFINNPEILMNMITFGLKSEKQLEKIHVAKPSIESVDSDNSTDRQLEVILDGIEMFILEGLFGIM